MDTEVDAVAVIRSLQLEQPSKYKAEHIERDGSMVCKVLETREIWNETNVNFA